MQQVNGQVGNKALRALVTRSSNLIPPFFARPEYMYNPAQLGRRLQRQLHKGGPVEEVVLPWGAPMFIGPDDSIGAAIWKTGVYDLIVAELLLRLGAQVRAADPLVTEPTVIGPGAVKAILGIANSDRVPLTPRLLAT